MIEINLSTLINFIKKDKPVDGYLINLQEKEELFLSDIYIIDIKISNCKFINGDLLIYDKYDGITEKNEGELNKLLFIENCEFEGLKFENCEIKNIEIKKSLITKNELNIHTCIFEKLDIWGFNKLSFNLCLKNVIVQTKCQIIGNDYKENGLLSIINSSLKNSSFRESKFNRINLFESNFLGFFDFYKNYFDNSGGQFTFYECVFEKANFNETTFSHYSDFKNCKFFKTTLFQDINSLTNSCIYFENCLFDSFVQFNHASIHKIEIDNVKFNDVASFQNTYFDKIFIDRTIFEKGALFDDIQIKNIDNCDRRTIRTIKLQLQKSENKIDFNRFRVYEFNAYQEDIKQKLIAFKKDQNRFYHRKREPIQLKRDLFILRISEFVSEYGTDWKRALKFTFFSGLIIYIFFYITENFSHEIDISDFDNWARFISGLFRFFLVTDFYNPLEVGRVYLTNPFSWIVFMFGKIVIAFGIYEMIQSFRKFKA